VVDELKVVAADVLDVLQRRRLEVVDGNDAVALREQVRTKIGAEKAGSPSRP
jgi:hypothetical protein